MENNYQKCLPRALFGESRARSLVKSLAYRIFSIVGTGLLTWIIIKDFGKTLSITVAIQIFLAILYYVHERIWNKAGWGRVNQQNKKMN